MDWNTFLGALGAGTLPFSFLMLKTFLLLFLQPISIWSYDSYGIVLTWDEWLIEHLVGPDWIDIHEHWLCDFLLSWESSLLSQVPDEVNCPLFRDCERDGPNEVSLHLVVSWSPLCLNVVSESRNLHEALPVRFHSSFRPERNIIFLHLLLQQHSFPVADDALQIFQTWICFLWNVTFL